MSLLLRVSNENETMIVTLWLGDIEKFAAMLQTTVNLADTVQNTVGAIESINLTCSLSLFDPNMSDGYEHLDEMLGDDADAFRFVDDEVIVRADPIKSGGDVLRVFPSGEVEVACRPGDSSDWVDSARLPLLDILRKHLEER